AAARAHRRAVAHGLRQALRAVDARGRRRGGCRGVHSGEAQVTALLPLIVPVLGAALASLAGARRSAVVASALASTIATFVVGLFLPSAPVFERPWLPGLGVSFALDPGGAASVLVVAVALAMV